MLVFRDVLNGGERIVADHLRHLSWSPDQRYVALISLDGTVGLFDSLQGQMLEISGLGRMRTLGWSPDGHYLAPHRTTPLVILDLSALESNLAPESLRFVGPSDDAIFADWGPDGSNEALLLPGYCDPEGYRLDRLDLQAGTTRRIPTAIGGFWVYDWSPRGDLIAVSSREIDGGFTLFDASTGLRTPRLLLDEAVTSMQDVQWSASGGWISLERISGRDRCMT